MLVLDVAILLAEPVRSMNTWYVAAVAGLAMVGIVVFLEQKRRQIPGWAETWRARLQTWS
jgi:hypothetical protein